MKGIIIYEDYRGKEVVEAIKLSEVDYYKCRSASSDDSWVSELSGISTTSAQAYCNKDDSYDFEIGALIALMKMCGKEKALKALKLTNESLKKDNESFRRTCEKLKKENKELHKNIDELFEDNKYWKSEGGRLSFEKHRLEEENDRLKNTRDFLISKNAELIEKNEKLKLDCEKLQHGYNDMIFCGGRQNGKQYTFLSNLFKGMPKDKVDAAYKEAYDKWIKLPSSRERMWDEILKEGRTPVYVKRENVHDFLEECQVTGIKWCTGKMPLETMPFHMSDGYDGIYFFVMTTLDVSKSISSGTKEFRHVMSWWMTASDEEARNSIKYLPPMRWDLFKKGRVYIRVKAEHFEEFKKACKAHLEKEPLSPFNYYSNGDVIVCYIDDYFRLTKVINGFKKRPIVNWEDVR